MLKDLGTAFENEVIEFARDCVDVEPDPGAALIVTATHAAADLPGLCQEPAFRKRRWPPRAPCGAAEEGSPR